MSAKSPPVDAMLRKAEALARQRVFGEARDLYAAVLERFPGNRRAAEGLKAVQAVQATSADGPSREEMQRLVGLFDAGRHDEVRREGAVLARRFPAMPLIPGIMGASCRALGRLDEAEGWYETAARLRPGHAETLSNLAMVQKARGDTGKAIASLERALEAAPGIAELHVNLGSVLNGAGRHAEALACLDRALAIKPGLAVAHNNRGSALSGLGRNDEAVAAFGRALEADPGYAEAHFNLGSVLMTLGRLAEAAASFAETLRLKPGHALAHANLGLVGKAKPGDPRIAQLRALAADPATGADDRISLGFALGKALDDTGDTEGAFRAFREANRLKKAQLGYEPGRDAELFRLIRAIFDGSAEAPAPAPHPGDRRPVFVVGMPRSGTTLVEQILSGHSRVCPAGELSLMEENTRPILDEARAAPGFRLSAEAAARVRAAYLAGLAKAAADASPVVTDKMPRNFRWIGFILAAMPEARIVHVRRAAPATCWSIFKLQFAGARHGYAYDLADIAAYYRLYLDLMGFWRARFPGAVLDVRYEALTEDPEREARAILDHCGLEWEPGCLDVRGSKYAVKTASLAQVRRGIYSGSSADWRRYEAHLGPLLRALGPEAG